MYFSLLEMEIFTYFSKDVPHFYGIFKCPLAFYNLLSTSFHLSLVFFSPLLCLFLLEYFFIYDILNLNNYVFLIEKWSLFLSLYIQNLQFK